MGPAAQAIRAQSPGFFAGSPQVTEQSEMVGLLHGWPEIRDSIQVRNTCLGPLHLLLAELLAGRRKGNECPSASQALKVTMAGIAREPLNKSRKPKGA